MEVNSTLDVFIQVLAKERDIYCKKSHERKRLDVESLAPDLLMPQIKHAPPYQVKDSSLLGIVRYIHFYGLAVFYFDRNVLGEGAFGLVTSGSMKVNNELISIAVKKFKLSSMLLFLLFIGVNVVVVVVDVVVFI
jgi:hypothetical protein